jgi:hypothetical protein
MVGIMAGTVRIQVDLTPFQVVYKLGTSLLLGIQDIGGVLLHIAVLKLGIDIFLNRMMR